MEEQGVQIAWFKLKVIVVVLRPKKLKKIKIITNIYDLCKKYIRTIIRVIARVII
jgi:hypothetical protein